MEIDKLAWIHIRERKLLGARSRGNPVCYLPGGKREPGESDAEALVREIREELSIALDPTTLVAAGEFRAQADGKPSGVMVKLTCYEAAFEGVIAPAAEIEEVLWLEYADRERCSAAGRLVLDHLYARDRLD
ncbi:NUDIX hydrolase [Dokdonella immobilis]|uniref:NUDIX domain-containing protein n=1 Tax=Dokdonella immobilis TaxID=578942 RepID=A0A1I4XW02_9GAMM|nr:NUDIX domain-containing protein [Dokdonella immobilis]SFN29440.1 NUDIX domain-containing protein [Dokdonella immobilis]